MLKDARNTRVLFTLVVFIAILLFIILTRKSILDARDEIVSSLGPARILVGALHGSVAQANSDFIAFRLTGNATYLDRYHLQEVKMEQFVNAVGNLLPREMESNGIAYADLNRAVEQWRQRMRGSLEPSSSTLSLEDLYGIEAAAASIHQAASVLEDAIVKELERQREHIDKLESVNVFALGGVAAVGFVLAIKAIRTNKQLEQALSSRNEVLRTVSHDLRNPLTPIRVAATFLDRELGASPSTQRYARMISKSVDTMNKMIEDLLEAARHEAGAAPPLELRRIPLHELMQQIATTWKVVADQKHIRFHSELRPCTVNADERRISEAISNVLANALKFTPPDGEVRLLCHPADDFSIEVSIGDTGPGISATELEHLFTPFWHKPKSGASGAGLGLFIVKRIVEEHGGSVSVFSEPGHGTTITLKLPIQPHGPV